MLHSILNKSWKQHPTNQLIFHLTNHPWHTEHYLRSKDEFIGLLHVYSVIRLAKSYNYQFCENNGCRLEDLPRAMNNRNVWRERFKGICAVGTPSWWWWWWWWWWKKWGWKIGKILAGLSIVHKKRKTIKKAHYQKQQ